MPTGYTADVKDGKITEFKDFAVKCLTAFDYYQFHGETRPDTYEPSSYHLDAIKKSQDDIDKLTNMGEEEIAASAEREYQDARVYYVESRRKIRDELDRYQKMLEKVRAWNPPTDKHVDYKEFMIEQLESSINFDGYSPTEPVRQDPDDWHKERLERALQDLVYHRKGLREEEKKFYEGKAWFDAVHESLGA